MSVSRREAAHAFTGASDGPAEILTIFPVPEALTAVHTTYLEGEPPIPWSEPEQV